MFTGVSLDQALRYWKNGKEVIVLDRTVKSPAGGYETYSLDELFKNLELLADVPAVENPEFSQTVDEMVHGCGQKREEPSGEGKPSPPPSARPEVSKLPAGKTTKEIILELAAQGMTAPEIARQTGIKYNTVYFHLNPDKCAKKPQKKETAERPAVVPGWNEDRHACKTCRYRTTKITEKNNSMKCNYISIAKHSRGCAVEDCDKYEKG